MNFQEFLKSCSILSQISPVLMCPLAEGTTHMVAELIFMFWEEPLEANEEKMFIDSNDEEEICVITATSYEARFKQKLRVLRSYSADIFDRWVSLPDNKRYIGYFVQTEKWLQQE